MAAAPATDRTVLLCRAGSMLCALPIRQVIEVMRPLPLEELPGAPDFVAGVSIVRGAPLPVVTIARLFQERHEPPGRLVVARAGHRRLGLAIDEVVGIRSIAAATLDALPPLLSAASKAAVAELASLDGELLVLLEAANVVSEEVFGSLDRVLATA